MTEYILLSAWLFFALYFMFRLVYKKAVAPYLLDRERFRVFAMRDQLRRISVNGGGHSFSHLYLEKTFNNSIQGMGDMSLMGLIIYIAEHMGEDGKIRNSNADYERFKREASPELKELSGEFSWAIMTAMAINSPILMVFFYVVGKTLSLFRLSRGPIESLQQRGEKVIYTHRDALCPGY